MKKRLSLIVLGILLVVGVLAACLVRGRSVATVLVVEGPVTQEILRQAVTDVTAPECLQRVLTQIGAADVITVEQAEKMISSHIMGDGESTWIVELEVRWMNTWRWRAAWVRPLAEALNEDLYDRIEASGGHILDVAMTVPPEDVPPAE